MSYRWPTMPDTGAAGVAGAIGDIGAEIGKLGETLNKIQAENQLAKFTAETAKIDNDLAYQLEQETDSTKYEKMVANADAMKERLVPSNGLAARHARRSLEVQKADSHKLLLESMLRREKLTQRDIKDAQRRAYLDDLAVKGKSIALSELGGIERARKWLGEQQGLSSAERGELEGRLTWETAYAEKKIEADRNEYIEKTEADFLNKAVKGELTIGMIQTSNLPPTGVNSKHWWLTHLPDFVADAKRTTDIDVQDVGEDMLDEYGMGERNKQSLLDWAKANRTSFSDTDYNSFIGSVDAKTDATYSSTLRDGKEFMKEALFNRQDMFGAWVASNVTEKDKYSDAKRRWTNTVNQYRKSGKFPSPDELYSTAKEIAALEENVAAFSSAGKAKYEDVVPVIKGLPSAAKSKIERLRPTDRVKLYNEMELLLDVWPEDPTKQDEVIDWIIQGYIAEQIKGKLGE